jgi:hypothetical protein
MRPYCTQNNGDCFTCSLVNYGRDCYNNNIMLGLADWARQSDHSGISARSLVRRGKLPEAQKIGRDWLIPAGIEWPTDNRYKKTSE